MVKIISNQEYAKLKEDVDYWKTLATTAVKEHVKRVNEYITLNEKYNELKILVNNEHHCDKSCFEEHVLPAIQRDYDYKALDFMLDRDERECFLKYWNKKLKSEYDFIDYLYMIADTIRVEYK